MRCLILKSEIAGGSARVAGSRRNIPEVIPRQLTRTSTHRTNAPSTPSVSGTQTTRFTLYHPLCDKMTSRIACLFTVTPAPLRNHSSSIVPIHYRLCLCALFVLLRPCSLLCLPLTRGIARGFLFPIHRAQRNGGVSEMPGYL